jgi:hypothetical protein
MAKIYTLDMYNDKPPEDELPSYRAPEPQKIDFYCQSAFTRYPGKTKVDLAELEELTKKQMNENPEKPVWQIFEQTILPYIVSQIRQTENLPLKDKPNEPIPKGFKIILGKSPKSRKNTEQNLLKLLEDRL